MKTSLLLVYFEAVVKVTTEKCIKVNACVGVRFSPSRPLLISLGSLFSGSSLFLLQSFLFSTGLIFTRTKSQKVSDCNKTSKRLVLIYPFNFICFHFSLGTCGTHSLWIGTIPSTSSRWKHWLIIANPLLWAAEVKHLWFLFFIGSVLFCCCCVLFYFHRVIILNVVLNVHIVIDYWFSF